MGEYAMVNDHEVKIGTCEDMYYLRADQRHLVVQPLPGSVDPNSEARFALRFRFPWPDEDGESPGAFEGAYERAVPLWGLTAPAYVEHYAVQFTAPGYNVCLPCPESPGPTDLTIHRNGFAGAVLLTQQKILRDGRTVPVLKCGGCGSKWRAEAPEDIEAVMVALRSEADRRERDGQGRFWHVVADRVAASAGL